MKQYKPYTAKKFKLPRRIMFFAAVAAVIFVLAVILGNVLKHRLETADIDTSEIPADTGDVSQPEPDGDDGDSVAHDEALRGVSAGCLSFAGVSDSDGARKAVDRLKSEGFAAVSFVAVGDNGMLTYASPAVQASSGLLASGSLVSYDIIKEVFSYAKDLGMRCSVVFTVANDKRDALLAAELFEAGADEVLVRAFESLDALDNNAVAAVVSYTEIIRKAAPIAVGVSLSPSVYTAAQNSPYIEKIYASAEYLAINMTDADSETASGLAEKLQGSFSAYMLRPVLQGSDADAAASLKSVLDSAGILSRQYISAAAVSPDDSSDTAAGG